jgi:predicted RNA binding protein YcfA (HicA-like mRNA interferase family)
VSGAETLKVLQRLGFEKVRQSGSHVVVRKGTRGCVIPMHSELKVGTLHGLLRQADISPEDFIANL